MKNAQLTNFCEILYFSDYRRFTSELWLICLLAILHRYTFKTAIKIHVVHDSYLYIDSVLIVATRYKGD